MNTCICLFSCLTTESTFFVTYVGLIWFLNSTLCGGAGAGAAGVLTGQPLDVVRVRLQQPHSQMPGALASLAAIVRAEGVGALFRGSFYPLTTIALQVELLLKAETPSLCTMYRLFC